MAPLYDVASALPYGVHDRKLRFAMKIGGTNDVYPHRNIWPAAARELGLDEEMLVARVRDLAAVAPEAFADAARASDVEALDRPLPARLVDLVSGRAARSLRLLGDPEAAA
jgi:serine/threonine-protein kinase HipA